MIKDIVCGKEFFIKFIDIYYKEYSDIKLGKMVEVN
jgi:hypothetical protein